MDLRTIKFMFTNGDMRKRILAVLGMILVFRFLAHVPIPLGQPQQLHQLLNNIFNGQQLFGFIDLLSGGALANFAIMLMGLGPYINASIIMQLLTIVIPSLAEMQKEGGEAGRAQSRPRPGSGTRIRASGGCEAGCAQEAGQASMTSTRSPRRRRTRCSTGTRA